MNYGSIYHNDDDDDDADADAFLQIPLNEALQSLTNKPENSNKTKNQASMRVLYIPSNLNILQTYLFNRSPNPTRGNLRWDSNPQPRD